MAAIVVAVLVDRGYLNYDDLVTKYWPEFGANGKDNVTVKMLVGHEVRRLKYIFCEEKWMIVFAVRPAWSD